MSTFDFMGLKARWFGISALLLIPGLVAMLWCQLHFGAPVRPSIDFTGGTIMQITLDRPTPAATVDAALARLGHADAQVQLVGDRGALIRTHPVSAAEQPALARDLRAAVGPFQIERMEAVGPVVGREILVGALTALGVTLLGIVGYLTFRYQLDFAVCAIAALVHDALFLLGAFAIMGALWGVEVDALFVTAVLTVIGFSVHDTIVVFDRLRENMRRAGPRDAFDDVANRSIRETLARSINTSLTVCLTLLAMLIFGGEPTRFFVLAMLLGVAAGAYSSLFNALQLLSWWRMRGVSRTSRLGEAL